MSKYVKFAAFAVAVSSSFLASAQESPQAEQLYDRVVQQDAGALDALAKLAKTGDPQALVSLGFIYEHGVTVPRDVNQAIQHYGQACALGGQYGCANAAYFYEYGIGVAQDRNKAEHYVGLLNKEGVDQAEIEGQRRIVYKGKAEAETDIEMRLPVIEYLERRVGSASSDDRALMERIGFSKVDTLRLARVWAERDNDPTMLFQVGSFYNFGYSHIENKNAEAYKWWARAAEAGEPQSQNLLGLAYAQGRGGMAVDPKLAVSWFERAAKQADKDALVNLGEIFYLGEIVPADYDRALSLFQQAAGKDSSRAARFLSWMYYNGQAVETNCDRALEYRQTQRSQRPDEAGDSRFLAQCMRDQKNRVHADAQIPSLRLQHKSTFHGGNGGALACEPHFVVTTDKLGEIANLRVVVELTNDKGATTRRTLAFSPFGLNTMNEDLDGREGDSFSSSTLVPMTTKEFCEFRPDFKIKYAIATVNGRNTDLLADGILKR